MTLRRHLIAYSLVALVSGRAAAGYPTENFVTDAPTPQLAKAFGEAAEKYRREKALEWLGAEMPRWPQRCPLRVEVRPGSTGGATTFTFSGGSRGGVLSQEMKIFGGVDQLMESVLPHEITHTVLAQHFGQAVPRWADEGGSVLSENTEERFNHDVRCREVLNQGRGIPLKHLFPMKEYPNDMIVLYAQGYSITEYLVSQGGRRKFLQFVGQGLRNDGKNWEQALRAVYGDRFASVDELQEKWIENLHTPPSRVAARNAGGARPQDAGDDPRQSDGERLASAGGKGSEMRSSTSAGLPMLEPPVVARGATPDRDGRTFGGQPVSGARVKADIPAASRARPPQPTLLPPEPPTRR